MARSHACGKDHKDLCIFIDWRRPEYQTAIAEYAALMADRGSSPKKKKAPAASVSELKRKFSEYRGRLRELCEEEEEEEKRPSKRRRRLIKATEISHVKWQRVCRRAAEQSRRSRITTRLRLFGLARMRRSASLFALSKQTVVDLSSIPHYALPRFALPVSRSCSNFAGSVLPDADAEEARLLTRHLPGVRQQLLATLRQANDVRRLAVRQEVHLHRRRHRQGSRPAGQAGREDHLRRRLGGIQEVTLQRAHPVHTHPTIPRRCEVRRTDRPRRLPVLRVAFFLLIKRDHRQTSDGSPNHSYGVSTLITHRI
jgi:hypothetical protein